MAYKQSPPFAVQVELVEGCNLYCDMCALTGIREKSTKNYKFMTKETLRSVMRQIVEADWNPRIEAAMHGDPLQHPDYVKMVSIMREEAPGLQLMITSNGGGLLRSPGPRENVLALFHAGLNILALDEYEGIKIVGKVRSEFKPSNSHETEWQVVDADMYIKCYEYPSNQDGSPHSRRPLRARTLTFMEDINKAKKGTHSVINNHAGVGGPPVGPDHHSQRQRCAKPFREMAVRWDGGTSVCCNDFRGYFKAGNVVEEGLEAVWNGDRMDAARRMLMHEGRAAGPCRGCDAVSHRVGLLPDKMGQTAMPRPTPASRAALARALAGPPMAAPVPRPWEQPSAKRR